MIIIKERNKYVFFSLIYILSICFYSCDLSEPTERFYNSYPDEQRNGIFYLSSLRPNQHITGEVKLTFIIDSLDFPVKRIDYFFDSVLFRREWSSNPLIININADTISEGQHYFHLGVVGENMGLYSMIGGYSLLLSYPIIIDHSPPTAVTIQTLEWVNQHPMLVWSQNNDSNFYYYIVERIHADKGPKFDTINDRFQTTYTDTDVVKANGIEVASYRVSVSNRSQKAISNIKTIGFGDTLPYYPSSEFFYKQKILSNSMLDQIYLYDENSSTFCVISTINHTPLLTYYMPGFAFMTLNDQSDTLFINDSAKYLIKLNLNNFSLDTLRSESYSFSGMSFILGKPDRGYFLGVGLITTRLSDGHHLSYTLHQGHYVGGNIVMGTNKNILYVTNSDPYIYKLDVTTDTPQVIIQKNTSLIRRLIIDETNNRILICQATNYVTMLDMITLDPISYYIVSNHGENTNAIRDLFLTSSYMYIVYEDRKPNTDGSLGNSGRVIKIRLSDMSLASSYMFFPFPSQILVPKNEQHLYVFTADKRMFIIPS